MPEGRRTTRRQPAQKKAALWGRPYSQLKFSKLTYRCGCGGVSDIGGFCCCCGGAVCRGGVCGFTLPWPGMVCGCVVVAGAPGVPVCPFSELTVMWFTTRRLPA